MGGLKAVIVIAVVLVAVSVWLAIRSRNQSPQDRGRGHDPAAQREEAGRSLRMMMLTTPAAEVGVTPTEEFPRIYGILMDWPLGEYTATLFSASTGDASLYTTSTLGVIGGVEHETVRTAAKALVRAADRFFDASRPTSEYPYPAADRIRFYFLTFDGVRVIETDLADVTKGTGTYSELFNLGQAVITELRLLVQERE